MTAGIRDGDKTPASARPRASDLLTDKAILRIEAYRIIQRRAGELGTKIGCHIFRATGITAYLEGSGCRTVLKSGLERIWGSSSFLEPVEKVFAEVNNCNYYNRCNNATVHCGSERTGSLPRTADKSTNSISKRRETKVNK